MPLTKFERYTVLTQLRDLGSQLDDIESEEDQLLERLSTLNLLKKQAQCQYDRLTNISQSPIHALPTELLSIIFIMAAHSSTAEQDSVLIIKSISHTCHRFRETAITTPSLWTHIDMREGRPYHKSAMRIERSGTCPLRIVIDQVGSIGVEERHFFSNILAPELHRSEAFHLTSHSIEPFQILLPWIATSPAPFLRKMELYYLGEELMQPQNWQYTNGSIKGTETYAFSNDAGQLHSLSISGIHAPWTSWTLRSLRELAFDFHSLDVLQSFVKLMDILATSSNLEKLSIMQGGNDLSISPNWYSLNPNNTKRTDFLDATGRPHPPYQPVTLLSLRELVFSFTEAGIACDLTRLLHAPNVHSLTLEYVKRDCAPLFGLLGGPPARFPAVTHLSLLGLMAISEGRILEFLRSAGASVTTLHINAVNCRTLKEIPFLCRWMAMERGSFLFPKLQEVTVEGLVPRQVREMVQSRPEEKRPTVRLRRKDCLIQADENMRWLNENINVVMVEGSSDTEDD